MTLGGYMSKDEMTAALSALDQALYVHEKWCENIYGSLICHLPPDERDLRDNAHHQCPFGQWYYAQQNLQLSQHPGFTAIASEHEQMHRVATQILNASSAGELIPVRDYNSFVNAVTRMRLEILNVSRELEDGLTNLDPLTGATSRDRMLIVIRKQRELVKRDLQTCAVVMMDMDLFKAINDDYGHQAGDAVLTSTAHYVMTHLRPYDEFFRYGDDEFLLCSPGTDLETGIDAIERLREGIAAMRIEINDGQALQATASFGITLLDPDVSVEESIARADQALYRAKTAGRNQMRVWDSSSD